jgi:hypothetical protein
MARINTIGGQVMAMGIGKTSGSKWWLGKTTGGFAGYRIDGIEQVMANINEELQKMKLKSHLGLIAAANYVLTDADIGTPPLVPHLTGNLRSSRFVEPLSGEKGEPFVLFGYEANYAAAVHEMMYSVSGRPINWTRPGSGPKFFEASIKRNQRQVLFIVADYAKIGL